MFTGIVQKTGEVTGLEAHEGGGRLYIRAEPWTPPVELGESIGVLGVCLTVADIQDDIMRFDILGETFAKTTLGSRSPGTRVNLERALKMGDPMGGHIVQGHVDGIGTVHSIEPIGRDWIFEINCDSSILDEMVYKGSIAIDGISLTVVDAREASFTVHIIPHTLELTCLGDLQPGHPVNLETDILAKYVHRLVQRGQVPRSIDWNELKLQGFEGG